MKRAFLFICLCLLAGAWLYQQIAAGSGYILISLGNTSVELSFWLGVSLLLIGLVVLFLLYKLVSFCYRLITHTASGAVRRTSLQVGSKAAQRRTARGLINFMESNWKQARKNLLGSVKKADYPLINYLAAARSSYELGHYEEAFELLHKAEMTGGDSGLAVALTQARMLLVNKKYEQCLANLQKADKLAPHHPVVLDLLKQTYLQLEDWHALKKIIPDLRQHKSAKDVDLQKLETTVYSALLKSAGEQALRQSVDEAAATLGAEWNGFPSDVRKQVPMLLDYVKLLVKTHNGKIAENLLRKEINHNWNDELVMTYGKIEGHDVKRQLLTAESWLKERPGSAVLLLALGRLSLRNELWSKAREYFESSLKLKKHPDTLAELARLLANLGDYEKSAGYYSQGLSLATDGLPSLPQPRPADVTPLKAATHV